MHEDPETPTAPAASDLERRLASQFPELTAAELAQHAGDPAEQTRPSTKNAGEQAALDRLAERLAQQFPELPAEDIVDTINGHYKDFDHSTIRDFVPVLVERAVRADIEHPATSPHRHRA